MATPSPKEPIERSVRVSPLCVRSEAGAGTLSTGARIPKPQQMRRALLPRTPLSLPWSRLDALVARNSCPPLSIHQAKRLAVDRRRRDASVPGSSPSSPSRPITIMCHGTAGQEPWFVSSMSVLLRATSTSACARRRHHKGSRGRRQLTRAPGGRARGPTRRHCRARPCAP